MTNNENETPVENGGAQEEVNKPFYAEFGFEDEASFVEHYKQISSKEDDDAPEPSYKFGILKDVESFLETEISTGSDEHTALQRAIDMVTNASKPWEKLATSNPVDVLVEAESRKYPSISKDDIRETIMAKYGLDDPEPDKDYDEEGHAKWMKRTKVATVKAIQDATEAAKVLEEAKSTLKVHPKVIERVTAQKQVESARTSLAPEYTSAIKKAASSFEIEVEGIKVPVKFNEDQIKMLSTYDPLGFATADGKKIDSEKVGGFLRNFAVASNFNEIAKALVNHGKSMATSEAVADQRNPGERRRTSAPGGQSFVQSLLDGLKLPNKS